MKKILVIENDNDIRDIIGIILKENDFEVIESHNPIPLEKVVEAKPNIILTDYLLEGYFGTDYCKELKKHPLTKHIPVVIFSAVVNIEMALAESCPDAFIEKPFDIEDFEDVIKKLAL